MASRIAAGELKLAMVVGGEALKTAQLARRENLALDWQESDDRPFEDRGTGEALATAHEFAHGLGVLFRLIRCSKVPSVHRRVTAWTPISGLWRR